MTKLNIIGIICMIFLISCTNGIHVPVTGNDSNQEENITIKHNGAHNILLLKETSFIIEWAVEELQAPYNNLSGNS